ncbi:sigma-70 family RNA polymerase sigma factor [Streptomyces sp. A7024]|uniref:RNA polymerase sigma factor n=1 Tax=Streptomyces coryli TaxID=1128680 RepID=A0A6G4UF17_9ACTN|nr:sigma-70 family RNA polymerase sigma factor [Streptomyces coryli]NGN70361.1 sigma-70 family RNA polymerase sigma factor [Streptomyces coryli]
MPDRDEFARLADPYREELLAHCYRMLGSIHDAEDLVQETYLRAWRAYDRFEGRASLRAWLYRIATRACLTDLERRGRRPLPADLGAPDGRPEGRPTAAPEVPWLEPYPGGGPGDPALAVASRESVRLAFAAALQHLPAKQRAVLLLRDVLGWNAAEAAGILDTSPAAVNSALQRARAQLQAVAPAEEDLPYRPESDDQRAFLERYVTAFEKADLNGMVELLREDVVLEMPPHPEWYAGREHVGRFFAAHIFASHHIERLVPVVANGQPAYGSYARDGDGNGGLRLRVLQVLTLGRGGGVARLSAFLDPDLFPYFGLPAVLR